MRTALRFPLRSSVECYLGDEEGWVKGTVVALYHREPSWEAGRWAPYQIRLTGGADEGALMWAPVDEDSCVRAG